MTLTEINDTKSNHSVQIFLKIGLILRSQPKRRQPVTYQCGWEKVWLLITTKTENNTLQQRVNNYTKHAKSVNDTITDCVWLVDRTSANIRPVGGLLCSSGNMVTNVNIKSFWEQYLLEGSFITRLL